MNRLLLPALLSLMGWMAFSCTSAGTSEKIDREALVKRHFVSISQFDSLSSLSVGNGQFAFTVDATGLQTFPELYAKGISLGTFSDWGWHSFPDTAKFQYDETLQEVDYRDRKITYDVQWNTPERKKAAADRFRQNPHRIHLGMIGLEMTGDDGLPITPRQVTSISQHLDLWEGIIHSCFVVEGDTVKVTTVCHPGLDGVAANIESPLIARGKLRIKFSFPYPSGGHVDDGCNWNVPEKHRSDITVEPERTRIYRIMDQTAYVAEVTWKGQCEWEKSGPHLILGKPAADNNSFSFSCHFLKDKNYQPAPSFEETMEKSRTAWREFWMSGGAVEFSGSTDPRACELERRVVLSQYLTRIQCAGIYPPQETGLTFNSWYGKFHLEMHWWHAVHFAFWNRIQLLDRQMEWYREITPVAEKIAARQGFGGVRWPKMTGPDGVDSPSSVGSFLIWQQPHYIYLAELFYRNRPERQILEKYAPLVFSTAEMMADYAMPDPASGECQLGPWLIPAQERLPAATTVNPPYELAYWYWGLQTAIQWKERLGMEVPEKWEKVMKSLPPLARKENLYLAAESAPDSYVNPRYMGDHPAVLGAFGAVPSTPLVDATVMKSTYEHILTCWDWPSTWGWDYPMMAMAATRLGMPDKALDALLMEVQKNTYLPNGHNYQNQRLPIYLPGNGGLLAAVALMCAGYEGCDDPLPGFPKDGTWKVRWENLSQTP